MIMLPVSAPSFKTQFCRDFVYNENDIVVCTSGWASTSASASASASVKSGLVLLSVNEPPSDSWKLVADLRT